MFGLLGLVSGLVLQGFRVLQIDLLLFIFGSAATV